MCLFSSLFPLLPTELLKALNRKASNNKRKFEDLAPASGSSLDVTIEPLRITLGQLQERHLAAARQEQEKNQLMNHTLGKAGSSSTADGSRPVIFSEVRDRHLSREFAEQFHESVLQSTRQKEQSQKLGMSCTVSVCVCVCMFRPLSFNITMSSCMSVCVCVCMHERASTNTGVC